MAPSTSCPAMFSKYAVLILLTLGSIVVMLFSLMSRWLAATPVLSFPSTTAKPPLLRLGANNQFHIAIFSDLHYGENEDSFGIPQDINSTRVMNDILDFEKPDFVVINGDLITGENTFLENATKYVDVLTKPAVDHNVPWASTYGNHDSQYNLSREGIFLEEKKYALSYTQHSPPGVDGVTNYFLPIFPHSQSSIKPVAILYFFDSQGGFPFQTPPDDETLPNYVTPSVVSWFETQQKIIHATWGDLPSLAFVHIPPTAFLQVQQTTLPNEGEESPHFPGLNDDVPLDYQGSGYAGEKDGPFMQALLGAQGLHSVYSGHDHGDAWCGNWPGSKAEAPHVCFCKHTGYGGYGSWNRGSRILSLTFDEGMEVETWVRMENGEIVQRVDLNSTYGRDTYPLEDGQNYSL